MLVSILERLRKYLLVTFYLYYILRIFTAAVPLKACFNEPLLTWDYALHFANSVSSSNFFTHTFKVWGYNPFFYAGYLDGVYQAVDNHWALFFQIILGNLLNKALVFNLSVFLGFSLVPLFTYFGAKNYKFGKLGSLFLVINTIIFILFFLPASYFLSGVYSYVISVFLAFYLSSLLYQFLNEKSERLFLKFTFWAILLFAIHPLSVVVISFFGLGVIAMQYKSLTKRKIAYLLATCCIVLLANLFWIYPYLKFSTYNVGFGHYLQTLQSTSQPTDMDYFNNVTSKTVYFLLLIPFFISVCVNYLNKRYKLLRFISVATVLSFAVAFYGTQLGLSFIEPARYAFVFYFIIILSISSIADLNNKHINWYILLYVTTILFFTNVSASTITVYCKLFYNNGGELLKFLKTNANSTNRLHVEQFYLNVRQKKTIESYYYALIPYFMQVEVLAGVHPVPPENVGWAQFVDGKIFGKQLEDISDSELESYLELYNIGYFVIHSDKAKAHFISNALFERVFKDQYNEVYKYKNSKNSFCLNCKAEVTADYNKINVTNAEGNNLILKYHYFDFLKVKPEGVKLSPILLAEDPIPFIKVENGETKDFTIYAD